MAEDPRCPECAEPVGVRATYCMHCGAEFDHPAGVDDEVIGTGDSESDAVDEITDVFTDEGGDANAGSPDVADVASGGGDTGQQTDTAGSSGTANPDLSGWEARVGGWLAPDSLLDDSLTVVVAVVAGLFIGPLAGGVLGIATGSPWAVAVGLVAWIGSTVYLGRRRTVFGAVYYASLAVAGLVVLLPVAALIGGSGPLTDRFVTFLGSEVVAGVFALPIYAVGRVIGRFRADGE